MIGKHDVLCSSLNFATPDKVAECDCNLSVIAGLLEALRFADLKIRQLSSPGDLSWNEQGMAKIAKARGKE
jgi:hypothetical protein